jgi:hypothetical protein
MCIPRVGHAGWHVKLVEEIVEFSELYVCGQPSCCIGSILTQCIRRGITVCSAARNYVLLLEVPKHFTPCHAYKKSSMLFVFTLSLMVLDAFSPKNLRSYNKYHIRVIPAVVCTTF